MKKLPEAELDIMMCLWEAGESVQRNYFNKHFDWADSTILTLLSRLIDKGFIVCTKNGNKNVYTALITKEDYLKVENRSFLHKLHKGSLKHFVASLVDADSLTENDIDDLEKLLNELKHKSKEADYD